MNPLHGHRHFVFDFDGTIASLQVDWASLREEVFRSFAPRYPFTSKRLPHMIEAIFLGGDSRDRQMVIELVLKHEQPGGTPRYRPINGMVELLRSLPGFYVVSNNLHSTVRQVLGELDLLERCRLVVGMDDVRMIKPSPQPFELLRTATGDPDGRGYLYAGDSPTDEAFAANAGMTFIHAKELL